jgi:GNAT superfamily N-acetyltransferase
MRIRPGDVADVPVVLALFDEAVAWMVARGNTEQWGTEPFSTQPHRVESVTKMVERKDLRIAELAGEPVGALVTSDTPQEYVEPAGEPELYVNLLLTSRRHAGREIGARLLSFARSLAQERGVTLIRVDCYRSEALVGYYERNGFVRTHEFTVGDWPGQVLAQRLEPGRHAPGTLVARDPSRSCGA